jgi:CRISPR/Cas system-associated exonuclease Cas4 (RecB family)
MEFVRRLFKRFARRGASAESRPRWHSVSSTREYELCPRRYRFAYVDRVIADRGLAPEGWRFGTVVHVGLEAGYRHHQAVGHSAHLDHTIPVALHAVRTSWAHESMPDDTAALERAERIVRRSLATTRLSPDDILGVEQYFRVHTPEGFQVAGAADLVVRAGADAVEIRDHKVTRHVYTSAELAEDFQLNVYGWLVRQEWPWAERVIVAHHYPLTGEIVRAELGDTQVEAALTRLRETAARAEADAEFVAVPGKHCASCVYAQLCPAARHDAA